MKSVEHFPATLDCAVGQGVGNKEKRCAPIPNILFHSRAFLFFITIFSVSTANALAEPLGLEYVLSVAGFDSVFTDAMVVDALGNVYIAGRLVGSADFDPGPGVVNLTSAGDTDLTVQKLDADGNLVWVNQVGGTGFDIGHSIALDASGNVYVSGSFEDTVDFDPGVGTAILTSTGLADAFVQKLDTNGNLVWVRQMGGLGTSGALAAAVDSLGNVYTTGIFEGTTDFDPGLGTANLTSFGELDIFVHKLDTNGDFAWAKRMGGTSFDFGLGIAVDASGNVHTTGRFAFNSDFDPGAGTMTLTSLGGTDIFIQKLDTNGGFVWAKRMGGLNSDEGEGIAVDVSGNVYTTGRFGLSVDFNPGAGTATLTSAGNVDVFVQKLNSNGSFLWAKRMGGGGFDIGTDIVVDSLGFVYTTGQFSLVADFDPGPGENIFTSVGGTDVFTQKLFANGDSVWAIQTGGVGTDTGLAIAVDSSAKVYDAGIFSSTVDFDPGAGMASLTSAGSIDMFVRKLVQLDSDNDGLSDDEEINTYGTNPFDPNSDADGVSDGDEVLVHGSDPARFELWVDFAWGGVESGTPSEPYRMFETARLNLPVGGGIHINGASGTTTTDWTGQISKPMRIESDNGSVTIGQ